jgi:ATP-dependent DNA ligase
MKPKSVCLFFSDIALGGTSDKEYRIHLLEEYGDVYTVQCQNGRRGGTMCLAREFRGLTLAEAGAKFDEMLAEKLRKGYQPNPGETAHVLPAVTPNGNGKTKTKFPVELLTEISRTQADVCLKSSKYWLQKKMDGHRRQLERKADGSVVSYNRKGEAVAVPQELAKACEHAPWETFLVDGELLGNVYYAFDLLEAAGISYTEKYFRDRFNELQTLRNGKHLKLCPTWVTSKAKTAGAAELYEAKAEGLVFRRTDAKYKPGRNGQHLKFKFLKTATCKVLELGTKGHDNAALGLFDGKQWVNVGGASMIGKDTRIKTGSLVEVRFLYCTEGNRLYQPRIISLRSDVDESACTFAQLKHSYKEGVTA